MSLIDRMSNFLLHRRPQTEPARAPMPRTVRVGEGHDDAFGGTPKPASSWDNQKVGVGAVDDDGPSVDAHLVTKFKAALDAAGADGVITGDEFRAATNIISPILNSPVTSDPDMVNVGKVIQESKGRFDADASRQSTWFFI